MDKPVRITAYLHDTMAVWRHDFHAHPVPGFLEHRASKAKAEVLRKLSIQNSRRRDHYGDLDLQGNK